MSKNNKRFKLNTREKEQNTRQMKVCKEIQIVLSDCFRKCGKLDPVLLDNSITITKLNISPDLKIVNCFYLPLAVGGDVKNKVQEALERSKNTIRHYVTQRVNLKYSPEIRFFFDSAYNIFSN